jgi:sugar phosphate isomerase/epimerase
MAEPHGITVVCEFLPIFPLSTLDIAASVVGRAHSSNTGILVDNLHLSRSGGAVANLAKFDRRMFPYLQIADAPGSRPTDIGALLDEALNGRLLPGDGELPIGELLVAVPDVPLSFEVRSRQLRETHTDATERARVLLSAARRTCLSRNATVANSHVCAVPVWDHVGEADRHRAGERVSVRCDRW